LKNVFQQVVQQLLVFHACGVVVLVALAAISAITGAMADANISGSIDQAYSSVTSNGAAAIKSIGGRGYTSGASGDTQIHVTGNEDLGGGMKANYKFDIGMDPNAAVHTASNRETWVGLSGGFGSLQIGTNYTPGFMGWLVTGGDPLGANNVVGNMVFVQQLNDGTIHSINAAQSVLYQSSEILPGVTVQAMKSFGGSATKAGDRTSLGMRYIQGPIAAQYSTDSIKGANNNFMDTTGAASLGNGLGTTNSGTDNRKSQIYSASYDLGVAKIATANSKSKIISNVDSSKATSYSISAPFGALTAAYTTSTATLTVASADTKYKGTQMGLTYAMSKRTNVYMLNGTQKDANNSAMSLKQTSFGMQHNF
jgi:predicted porin